MQTTRVTLRDTLWVDRPVCAYPGDRAPAGTYHDTLQIAVRAVAVNPADSALFATALTGRTRLVIRCRAPRAVEIAEGIAFVDSFPDGNRRITIGDMAVKLPKHDRDQLLFDVLRTATTAADSARHRSVFAGVDTSAESLSFIQRTDSLRAIIGYVYQLCYLGRNRYTGAIVILDGDPSACEAARTRWQSERAT